MTGSSDGPDDWETGWRTHLIYDGTPCEITWFPERMGLQITTEGSDELGEARSNEVAVFGLTLIKLMRSGADCMQEI
jgi:hypothetical protein